MLQQTLETRLRIYRNKNWAKTQMMPSHRLQQSAAKAPKNKKRRRNNMHKELYRWVSVFAILITLFLGYDLIGLAQTSQLNEETTPTNNNKAQVNTPVELAKLALADIGKLSYFDFSQIERFPSGIFITAKKSKLFGDSTFKAILEERSIVFGAVYLVRDLSYEVDGAKLKKGFHLLSMNQRNLKNGTYAATSLGIPSKELEQDVDFGISCTLGFGTGGIGWTCGPTVTVTIDPPNPGDESVSSFIEKVFIGFRCVVFGNCRPL